MRQRPAASVGARLATTPDALGGLLLTSWVDAGDQRTAVRQRMRVGGARTSENGDARLQTDGVGGHAEMKVGWEHSVR